jgi:RND family efflux transporter MFP subunit
LDQEILDRAQKAAETLPEVFLLNARRNVLADANAVRRAEGALSVRGLSPEDLKALKDYAAGLDLGEEKRDRAREKSWARWEVRAPQDGIIVEINVAVHEVLADTSVLFTIADPRLLLVLANANEDQLRLLRALTPEQRRWTIRPTGTDTQPVEGRFGPIEDIGYRIDPNQHSALVAGTAPNPEGRLRAGQYVTATVALPTLVRELAIPTSALVESGQETIVFIRSDPTRPVYVQRHVVVVRRGRDTAHVRLELKPGEQVVTAGALDLQAALDDLEAEKK